MVEEERIKDITQTKQAKYGSIEIAGVVVALDPFLLSYVLLYLVSSHCLIMFLRVRHSA